MKFESARIHFLSDVFIVVVVVVVVAVLLKLPTSEQSRGFVSLRMTPSFLNQCNIKQIFVEI